MNIKYINLLQKIVKIKEINAKTILRKHKKIDSWFVSRYGMNLYRGCTHNCVYCDGRAEKYNVEGSFGDEVTVKVNAIELLKKELEPKRKPLDPGYMLIGGGVGDSYQPVEKQYKLTRRVLELLSEKDFPVHVLTKSVLVERDVDILKKINENNRAIVSFSFSSADDKISEIFEPGVPPPSERLETIKNLKKEGFSCGMYLMPVIPFISDKSPIMDFTLSEAKRVGVDFVVFSGMTLKDGRQREYFDNVLVNNYPELVVNYNNIYRGDKWGSAIGEYYESIHKTFSNLSRKHRIPVRIPSKLFKEYLKQDDLVIVLLEQIDYMLKLQGRKSPYGFAAYYISKLERPLYEMRNNLQKLKGVGPTTERIILEILDTGTSSYYEKLINQ